MNEGAGAILLIIVVGIYFLPMLVALVRDHHQVGFIAVINIFLGWTLIGWVVALAIACSATKKAEKPLPIAGAAAAFLSDERDCPHCAERIKKAAKVCRFCNRDVAPA